MPHTPPPVERCFKSPSEKPVDALAEVALALSRLVRALPLGSQCAKWVYARSCWETKNYNEHFATLLTCIHRLSHARDECHTGSGRYGTHASHADQVIVWGLRETPKPLLWGRGASRKESQCFHLAVCSNFRESFPFFLIFDLTLASPAVTLGTIIFRKTAHGSKSVGGKKAVLLCCATMMKPTQRRCCSKERSREHTSPASFF